MRTTKVLMLALLLVAIALPASAGFVESAKSLYPDGTAPFFHVGDMLEYYCFIENPRADATLTCTLAYDVFAPGTPAETRLDWIPLILLTDSAYVD